MQPTEGFVEMYDNMILSPQMQDMYNGSGFYNVGDWGKAPSTLGAACHEMVSRHIEQVDKQLHPKSILDVACGLGKTSSVIAESFPGASVTGINISSNQVQYAKEHHNGIDFLVMDATDMQFPSGHFDLIISIEAVFHFNTRKDFIHEAYRILRPGGQLVFTDILFHNTDWVGKWSVPSANLVTDVEAYQQLFIDAGFQVTLCEDITALSVKGFCNHLRSAMGMHELANGFENSILAYLLVSLQKPY